MEHLQQCRKARVSSVKRSLMLSSLLSCLCMAQPSAALQSTSLCTSGDWFVVQQAQSEGNTLSPLCAGELDVAENRSSAAEKELSAVIAASPQSEDAYAAHSALTNLAFRNGLFRNANAHLLAMSAIRPTASEVQNVGPLLRLLAASPDLRVASTYPKTIQTHVIDGNVFAPLVLNGKTRAYMLDTGMNLSMMSESEAKSLGLAPQTTTTSITDISGLKSAGARVVEVHRLVIGGTELRHVPFLVVEDTNGAFVGIPAGQQGILGIQPILALRTLEFRKDGTLRVGGRGKPASTMAPLLFDGAFPLSRIDFQGQVLTVTFDMGATQSTMNPPFAKLFPELIEGAKSEDHKLNGISGSSEQRSVSLSHLSLMFGRLIDLSPATVLLDETTGTSSYAAANMGYDLMQQARPFTIDFRHMLITFR